MGGTSVELASRRMGPPVAVFATKAAMDSLKDLGETASKTAMSVKDLGETAAKTAVKNVKDLSEAATKTAKEGMKDLGEIAEAA